MLGAGHALGLWRGHQPRRDVSDLEIAAAGPLDERADHAAHPSDPAVAEA